MAAKLNKVTLPGVTSTKEGTNTVDRRRIDRIARTTEVILAVTNHLFMAVNVLSMSSAVIIALELSS